MISSASRSQRQRDARPARSSALVVLVVLLLACGEDRADLQRLPGDAIWLSRSLPAEMVRDLSQQAPSGLEGYVDAGLIDRDGSLEREPPMARGSSLPVHLVARGELLPSMPETWASSLAAGIAGLRLDLQNQGQRTKGLLLWLENLAFANGDVSLLRELRKELDQDLAVGLWIADDVSVSAVQSHFPALFDYAVVEYYGQPWSATDDPVRWELSRSVERIREIHRAGIPVRALVRAQGRVSEAGSGTALSGQLDPTALDPLLRTADASFHFEGYDRQLFTVDAPAGFEVPDRGQLPRPTKLTIMRPTEQHLQKAIRKIREIDGESMDSDAPRVLLADLAPADALGPTFDRADDILQENARVPDLALGVQASGSSLRIDLQNVGGPTGVGQLRHNYVEVSVEGGSIAAVDPGDFPRYTLGGDEPESRREMRLGTARVLRLHIPVLAMNTALSSGRVVVRGANSRIRVRAHFLDPLGNVVEVEEWTRP